MRPKRPAKGFVVAAARGSFVLERVGGYGQELGVCAVGALEGVLAAIKWSEHILDIQI